MAFQGTVLIVATSSIILSTFKADIPPLEVDSSYGSAVPPCISMHNHAQICTTTHNSTDTRISRIWLIVLSLGGEGTVQSCGYCSGWLETRFIRMPGSRRVQTSTFHCNTMTISSTRDRNRQGQSRRRICSYSMVTCFVFYIMWNMSLNGTSKLHQLILWVNIVSLQWKTWWKPSSVLSDISGS